MTPEPHWTAASVPNTAAEQATSATSMAAIGPTRELPPVDIYGRPVDPFGRPLMAPQPRRRDLKGMLGTIGSVLLLVVYKFGAALKFLLVFFKFSKIGATTISMVISAVVYGAIFGWAYGIGFVLLMLVHEMGHVWAARIEGIKVSAPMFIPFLGAMITMRERPTNSLAEARIAAGGPILGSLGALACYALFAVTHQPLLLALAYIGFFLNLFNLVPVSPLDGGRILGAASKWALLVGLPILAVFAFTRFNPFLFYFLLLGALEVWHRFRTRDDGYFQISTASRWLVVGGYILLAASVAWGMSESHALLQSMGHARSSF